jgi:hypothetical protein
MLTDFGIGDDLMCAPIAQNPVNETASRPGDRKILNLWDVSVFPAGRLPQQASWNSDVPETQILRDPPGRNAFGTGAVSMFSTLSASPAPVQYRAFVSASLSPSLGSGCSSPPRKGQPDIA